MSSRVTVESINKTDWVVGWKNYGWNSIEGSPIEVGTFEEDPAYSFRFRWNEDVAEKWLDEMLEKRAARIEEEARQWAQGKARYDD